MFTKSFNTAVVALAASSLVSAQTFTDCDPTKKCTLPCTSQQTHFQPSL